MTTKKYYEILGISETATDSEIKKAYRREALHWHPDKNQDRLEEANERFKLISEAYEVLKDPEQRAIYNKFGDEGFKERASGGASADYGSAGFHSFHFSNPEDIFREFFGGQDPFSAFFDPFGGSGRRGSNGRRSNDPFSSMFGNSFFDDDDFFGGHGNSGFSSFSSTSFGGPGASTFSSFSSSSFGGGMGGGNFVSTSQKTTVVNGKKTIIKETRDGNGNTTVEKTTIEPDGRRIQETIVNGKQQSLITDNTNGGHGERLRLEDQHIQHGQQSQQSPHSEHSSHHIFGHRSHRNSASNAAPSTTTTSTTHTTTSTSNKATTGSGSPKDKSKKFGFHHFF